MEKNAKQEETLRLKADLEGNYLLDKESRDLKAIGLFYAPAGGNVHKIAKRIKQKIKDHKVEMFCITDITPEKLLDYRTIIIVSSALGRHTWDKDQRDKWAVFAPGMRKLALNGRRVALVGLGDHLTYPANYVDGMGDLADVIESIGGVLIGKTSIDGYSFTASRALRDGLFVGLALDEDFEPERSDARIEKWLTLVSPEF